MVKINTFVQQTNSNYEIVLNKKLLKLTQIKTIP
jgi:hypothetical protein